MTISPRRRRKKVRRYMIAGAALACMLALIGVIWAASRKRNDAASAAPQQAAVPVMAATRSAVETPAPTPTEEPSPSPSPTPARTPAPTPEIRKSGLTRSLYQGSLSMGEESAEGRVSLTYVNNGVETLYALYFHLYPNVQSPGSLAVRAVALNGVRAYYTLSPGGETLCVPLVRELRSGEAARVYVEFSAAVPKEGFGEVPGGGKGLPLYGIFPTVAVYENEWVREATPGEVDYSPLADWRLLVESAAVPSFSAGEVREQGEGKYLCTARTAQPELWLE